MRRICTHCASAPFFDWEIGSTFKYEGPIQTFLKLFKYYNQWNLAQTAAAFMLMQWDRLNWPVPDVIVAVPQFPLKTLFRGYNQSRLLAEALAKLLKVRHCNVLRKKLGRQSQSLLKLEERKQLSSDYFGIKSTYLVQDKIVMVIDDVLTTGTTLKCSAETLLQAFPKKIYALTLCDSGP